MGSGKTESQLELPLAGAAAAAPEGQRWHDGVRFPYLGRVITLRLEAHGRDAQLRGDELLLPLPPEADGRQIRDGAHAWLQTQARRVLEQRVHECARRLGLVPPPWQLSFATASWGEVDQACRLRLAWRLIHLSLAEIDGVVVRQLSRLPRQAAMSDLWSHVELPA